MNGLIAAINIASLKLNVSPVASLTIGFKEKQMSDVEEKPIETIEDPDAFDSNISYVDLVV